MVDLNAITVLDILLQDFDLQCTVELEQRGVLVDRVLNGVVIIKM